MNIVQLIFRWLPDFLYFRELNLTKQQWFFYKWVKRHLKWAYMSIECEKVIPPHDVVETNLFLCIGNKVGRMHQNW